MAMDRLGRKHVRLAIPKSHSEEFERQKAITEEKICESLTYSQYAARLIVEALNAKAGR